MANTTTTPTGATGPALNLQQAMNSGGLSFASPPTTPVPTPTPVPIPGQSSVQPTGGTPFSLTGTMNTPQAPQAPSSTPGTTGGSTGGTPQTQFSQNQTPNQLPNQTPTQGDPTALSQAMLAIQNQVSNSNNLVTQKNLILKQLYDQPLSDADKAQLDPALASVLASGDRNAIDFNLKLLNDQIAGRTNSLAQNVQYLTQGYNTAVQQAAQQKQDAITNVLNYARANGQRPSVILQALYPDLAKQLGPTLDQIAAPYSTTTQNTTGSTGYANNDPIRIVQNNNPIAVAMSTGSSGNEFTQALDAAGIPWQQGTPFSDNPGMSTINILGDPVEASRAVLANTGAIQNWYINHSGANILSQYGVKNNQDFQKLSTANQNAVIQGIYQGEGGQGNLLGQTIDGNPPDPSTANTVDPATGITPNGLYAAALQYAVSNTMPPLGLGSAAQTKIARQQIISKAGAILAQSGSSIAGNKAAIASNAKALDQQTTYLNTIQRSVNTVEKNIELLQEAAKYANNSSVPIVNQLTNNIKLATGDGALNAYNTALQTVRSEYANILARGGQVTDQNRSDAASLLPSSLNAQQLNQVISVLQSEGKNVISAAQGQVQSIQDQINNIVQPQSSSTNSNTQTMSDGSVWQQNADGSYTRTK